jgi:lysine 2,3-aminomutase
MITTVESNAVLEFRPAYYENVSLQDWNDWKWQQKNSVRSFEALHRVFPEINDLLRERLDMWNGKNLRIALTPYMLAQINRDWQFSVQPIWQQYFPDFGDSPETSPDEYTPDNENWEMNEEMLTAICQWKYDNRAIIYSVDTCFAYCTFCLRSLQSNDKNEKHGGYSLWDETVRAIAAQPQIEEVILSGGDPLMYPNEKLERMLSDLRSIPTVRAISLNSRALSHNPFRVDDELVALLKKYRVTKMGLHVNHSAEITDEFVEAVQRIQAVSGATLLLGQTVLLKGVNDSSQVLRDLFMNLYTVGIKPYYLFHNMPNIPAARQQRTPVRKGVELINSIKRRVSNPAIPEFIIAHRTGKKTVPLDPDGTDGFRYTQNEQGHRIIRFLNWKNELVDYLDGMD